MKLASIFPVFFCVGLLSGAYLTAAPEFRVDDEVKVEGRHVVRSTTYFLDKGNFLNIVEGNGEIRFYDAEKGVVTLLDPKLRLQTHLSALETKKGIDMEREKNRESAHAIVAFAAKPVFQQEFDADSGRLSLQSPWFDYQLTTEPFGNEERGARYLDFCDWSCYLNFRTDPAWPTPLVRLEVNRLLREAKRIPKTVVVSFYPKGKGFLAKEEKAESSHRWIRRMDESDKRRIDRAEESMKTFPLVPFAEYRTKISGKSDR